MRKKVYLCAMAALILAGCSDSRQEETETSVPVSETAAVTEVYSRDIDVIGEERSGEMLNYFYLSKTAADKEFYPNESSVKFGGRHILHDGVQYLSYSCSSVDFIMTGDRLEAVMVSNGHLYNDRQQAYVGVVIDGELTKRICLDGGENTYVLYEGDMLYNAKISVIKLSENQQATAGIKSMKMHGRKLSPDYEKELMFEFIGDSLTCGYGNEHDGPSGSFDTADENGMKTYAYLTAQAFDADCSLVAISGIGVISDYTSEQGEKEDYLLMPENYGCTDMNFQMRRGYDEYEQWDFGGGSDIVVINLGTNDATYTGRNSELMAEFGGAYYDFIGQVREKNPDADIICTLGMVGSELYEQIEYAAEMFREDHSDDKIHTFRFSYVSEEDGYGTDYHPSAAAHETAAEELTEFIRREIMSRNER